MKRMKFVGAALVVVLLLIRAETAVAGAQRAMRLWVGSVAPALFPFLALMPALTGREACAAYNAALSKIMRPLFGLPGSAAPALVIGMISGSPGGALAVRRIASETGMSRAQAARIALALGGVSPAYLIMGVGYGLYGSAALGVKLAIIQAAVQLMLLVLLRGACDDMEGIVPPLQMEEQRGAVRMAAESVLVVCGYMVLFSCVASVAVSFLGEYVGTVLLLAADLPSGLAELAKWEMPGKMLIQGAAIGFGGLCIASQNLDALRPVGLDMRGYIAVRSIASAAFACICGLALDTRPLLLGTKFGNPGKVYALSLLAASAAAIPGLIFLSKKIFLNNRK